MAEHTKGPWHVDERNGQETAIIAKDGAITIRIATVCGSLALAPMPEIAEDARLIAAAPDLLAALVRLDEFWTLEFPDGPDGSPEVWGGIARLTDETLDIWRQARAAIHLAKHGAPASTNEDADSCGALRCSDLGCFGYCRSSQVEQS